MTDRHRFVIDDYETCAVCGSDLESAYRDAIHWFGSKTPTA